MGENSLDILATVPHWPSPDEKLELVKLANLPGGQAASASVGCARLGCRAQYIGVFGDDEHGRLVERALREEGVDTSACLQARAPNRSAMIIVDGSAGTRAVLWSRDRALRWPDISTIPAYVSQARLLLVDTTDVEAATAAAEAAGRAGVPVVIDVDHSHAGVDRLLRHVDVLVASEGFPLEHTGEASMAKAIRQLRLEYGVGAVVVTLGRSGAVCWDGAAEVYSPGFVVPVVDSTGAGDAFRAGFMTAWLLENSPGPSSVPNLLNFANATAALKCRAVGAQTGLPTRAEVIDLLTDRTIRRSNQAGSATEAGHP